MDPVAPQEHPESSVREATRRRVRVEIETLRRSTHPARAAMRAHLLVGTICVGLALVSALVLPLLVPVFALLGAFFFLVYFVNVRSAEQVPGFNLAFGYVGEGRLEEAEAILDEIEPQLTFAYLKVAVQALRAVSALQRGAFAETITFADAACAPRRCWIARAQRKVQRDAARSARALALALAGSTDKALAEVAALESEPLLEPRSVGRLVLAQMAAAARAGDRSRLRELVRAAATNPSVAELLPRERALLRSYRQLAYAPGQGAYRELVNPETAPERVFVAEYTQDPRPDWDAVSEAPAVHPEHKSRGRRAGALFLAWIVAVVLIVVVMGLLGGGPGRPDVSMPALVGVVVTAVVAVVIVRTMIANRVLRAAAVAQRRGDREAFLRAATSRTLLRNHLPMALRMRAEDAYTHGELEAVLQRTDEALGWLAKMPTYRALHMDLLVSGLIELRAKAFAGLGRAHEANAELALLQRECPGYAFRARARYVVALFNAVHAQDWPRARELVLHHAAGSQISVREEVLGDLVRMREVGSAEERQRVKTELDESKALRDFIEAIAPDLAQAAL